MTAPVDFVTVGPGAIPDNGLKLSTGTVSGLTGRFVDVSLTLGGLSHTFGPDLDILLIAPGGGLSNLEVLSDTLGPNQSAIDLTLSDSAATSVPSGALSSSGTFKPTDNGEVETSSNWLFTAFPINHPGSNGTATFASAFAGIDPNGDWLLAIRDDDGGDAGNLNSWTLSITTNEAPVATDQAHTTAEDVPFVGQFTGTDAENDPLTFQVQTKPLHGTLIVQPDGHYTYTPFSNFSGTDSFTYVANDGLADPTPSLATVTMTVTNVNDAPTFVVGPGKFTTDFAAATAGVAVQSDSKIVIVGTDSSITRYNSDGTLDTSFGAGGVVAAGSLPGGASDIVIQPDGKILVAGQDSVLAPGGFSVVRYNSDGSLDTTFGGGDGKATIYVDGTAGPDASNFPHAMALQPDGKIVVIGEVFNGSSAFDDFAAVRFNADGTTDTTFDGDGAMSTPLASTTDEARGVAIQPDGKILIAGDGEYFPIDGLANGLVRLNADGSVDQKIITTWGSQRDDIINDVFVQPDGKVVILGATHGLGESLDIILQRYAVPLNGSDPMDHTFGMAGTGRVIVNLGVASSDEAIRGLLLPDGKIMVAAETFAGGHSGLALLRFNDDGSFDTTFGDGGKVTTQFAGQVATTVDMAIQPDGKLVLVGTLGNFPHEGVAVVRYNLDGTIDQTFRAVNTLDGAPAYVKGGAPVILDSDVLVYDAELQVRANSYFNSTLTLVRHGGADPSDVFGFTGDATLDSNVVYIAGNATALINQNSGGQLNMRFLASATQDSVEAVMHGITYSNNSSSPPSSAQIDWTFSDGNTGSGSLSQGPGGAKTTTGSTTVSIVNTANGAPTDIALSNASVAENSFNGTVVGSLSDTDPDIGDTAAFTLTGNAGGRFAISGSNLVVANGALLNFEQNTSHSVTVKVTDSGGLSFAKVLAIGVANVDEAPTNIALSNASVAENSANGKVVGSLSDTDPDSSDTAAFTLTSDAGGRFAISGGNLVVANGGLLDFESNTSHSVTVRVTDSGGLHFDKAFTIAVTDVNETVPSATPHPFQYAASVGLGNHSTGWQIAGAGDFNGDGTADVLWRETATGQVDEWQLQDGAWKASVGLGSHGTGWQVAGIGDLNGDGASDVLWREAATGKLDAWILANGQWSKSVDLGSHGTDWKVLGVGDTTGDGTADVLFQNTSTGAVDEWKIKDGNWNGSLSLGSHGTAYSSAALGDFNGDGTADVIWHNPTTGAVDEWQLKNGQWAGSVGLGNHGGELGSVNDFNADGTSDVLWRDPSSGAVDGWVISHGQWFASVSLGSFITSFRLAATGDFNHADGADVLWHNEATGLATMWLLHAI